MITVKEACIIGPIVLIAGLSSYLDGCGATAVPPIAKVDEVAMFTTALQVCWQTATSRAQADTCRAGVETSFCGPGGALASSAGCQPGDGGK